MNKREPRKYFSPGGDPIVDGQNVCDGCQGCWGGCNHCYLSWGMKKKKRARAIREKK